MLTKGSGKPQYHFKVENRIIGLKAAAVILLVRLKKECHPVNSPMCLDMGLMVSGGTYGVTFQISSNRDT